MKIQTHELYPTRFLIGPRIINREPQLIGTVIVKGLFQNMGNPVAASANQQIGIFSNDVLFENNQEVKYESDLVPFKPFADAIILGASQPPEFSQGNIPTGEWFIVLEVSTGSRLEKTFTVADPEKFPTKTIFGWASRGEGERLEQAGQDLIAFNPNSRLLPEGFDNLFYNGYDRELSGDSPLPYLADGARLNIRSERRTPASPNPNTFSVQLPMSRPLAILKIKNDREVMEEQAIALMLDTVIIEPEQDQFIVVWRGTWLFDEALKDRYVQIEVQGGV